MSRTGVTYSHEAKISRAFAFPADVAPDWRPLAGGDDWRITSQGKPLRPTRIVEVVDLISTPGWKPAFRYRVRVSGVVQKIDGTDGAKTSKRIIEAADLGQIPETVRGLLLGRSALLADLAQALQAATATVDPTTLSEEA